METVDEQQLVNPVHDEPVNQRIVYTRDYLMALRTSRDSLVIPDNINDCLYEQVIQFANCVILNHN